MFPPAFVLPLAIPCPFPLPLPEPDGGVVIDRKLDVSVTGLGEPTVTIGVAATSYGEGASRRGGNSWCECEDEAGREGAGEVTIDCREEDETKDGRGEDWKALRMEERLRGVASTSAACRLGPEGMSGEVG